MDRKNGNKYYYSKENGRLAKNITIRIGYNDYTFDNNGILIHKQYVPFYYMKKDSRWNAVKYNGHTIGGTGCAPTSMAMVFTSINKREILPLEVANYLYWSTNDFNRYESGSNGYAIFDAANNYGVKATGISSKAQLIDELKKGKIVFTAMQNGKFATTYWNHAIVVYCFVNNYTTVLDPLQRSNNGLVSVDLIWNEQSWNPDDRLGGYALYSLEK